MNVRDVLLLLEMDGWYVVVKRGSHRQLKNDRKAGRVTLAVKSRHELTCACSVTLSFTSRPALKRRSGVKRYAIVIEKARSNYAAYVPDLPGCVATGATVEETETLLREAIDLHLVGMREDGLPVPEPASVVEYLDVPA
jgi:predicted RNase H-like HicB family nuclease/predicted RNA binding protein YcfA (HicA-like mRNA interferase family)